MGEPLISAVFIFSEEGVILEASGDCRIFLKAGEREFKGKSLPQAGPELQRVLGGPLRRAARGRSVENYAFPFKVGKRIMPMLASAAPYPLAGQGKVGVLLKIRSREERPDLQGRAATHRPLPLPIPGLLDLEEHGLGEDPDVFDDPLCVLDSEGRILRANAAMCRVLGADESGLRGSRFSELLEGEGDAHVFEQALETVRLAPWRGELGLKTREGGTAVLSVTVTRLKDAKGALGGFLANCRDITAFRLREEEREKETAGLGARLEQAPCPIICGRGQTITFANREAGSLLGIPSERLRGMSLRDALGEEGAEVVSGLLQGKVDGLSEAGRAGRFTRRGPRGMEMVLRVKVVITPSRESVVEYEACLEDLTITETLRERAEEAGRLGRFLKGMGRAFSTVGDNEALRECLDAFMALTGAAAGALYLLEGEEMIKAYERGFSAGTSAERASWRVRPNRFNAALRAWAEPLRIDCGAGDEARRLAFLRESEGFLAAHQREGCDRLLLVPLRSRKGARGLMVLALKSGDLLSVSAEGVLEDGLALAARLMGSEKNEGDEGEEGAVRLEETMGHIRHRLSTPLTCLRGFAQMLVEEGVDEETRAEAAEGLCRAVDGIVDELDLLTGGSSSGPAGENGAGS